MSKRITIGCSGAPNYRRTSGATALVSTGRRAKWREPDHHVMARNRLVNQTRALPAATRYQRRERNLLLYLPLEKQHILRGLPKQMKQIILAKTVISESSPILIQLNPIVPGSIPRYRTRSPSCSRAFDARRFFAISRRESRLHHQTS